jgi:hypothetical protein
LLEAEQQRGSHRVAELPETLPQRSLEPDLIERFAGQRSRIDDRRGVIALDVRSRAAARLRGIEHAVARDPEQPGLDARAAAEAVQTAVRVEEHLLLDIIGERCIAQRLAAVAIYGTAVPLHQSSKCTLHVPIGDETQHLTIIIRHDLLSSFTVRGFPSEEFHERCSQGREAGNYRESNHIVTADSTAAMTQPVVGQRRIAAGCAVSQHPDDYQ